MSPSILITLILATGLCFAGQVRGLWAYFASLPLGASAGLIFPSGQTIVMSEALTFVLALGTFFSVLSGRISIPRGLLGPLCVLAAAAGIGVWVLPHLFSGATEVSVISVLGGQARMDQTSLGPEARSWAQLGRFWVSLLACGCIGILVSNLRTGRPLVGAIMAMIAVHLVVSLAEMSPLTAAWLSEIKSVNMRILDDQMLFGRVRATGGFPEPSSYGAFALGAFVLWVFLIRRPVRVLHLSVAAVLLFFTIASLSTATWAALGTVGAIALVWTLFAQTDDGAAYGRILLIALCPALAAAGLAAMMLDPFVSQVVKTLTFNKLASASGIERLSLNAQAWQNFVDTAGLGVGLGSLRGSGWIASALGSLGVWGAFFFAWVLLILLKSGPIHSRTAFAFRCAALAMILQACLIAPYPNLETPVMVFLGAAYGLSHPVGQVCVPTSCGDKATDFMTAKTV